MSRTASDPRAITCDQCATRSVCLTRTLSGEEMAQLRPHIRQRAAHRGESMCEEGEVSDHVRVLKVGTVFGYRRGLDGVARPIGVARRGAAFGVLGVFGKKNLASARVMLAGRVCEIPADAFKRLAASNRCYVDDLAEAALGTCSATAAWGEAMRINGAVNQLAYVLVLMADAAGTSVIELPPRTALAELLGATRETVVRALSTLEAEGSIVRLGRRQCEIHRKPLLARVARKGR